MATPALLIATIVRSQDRPDWTGPRLPEEWPRAWPKEWQGAVNGAKRPVAQSLASLAGMVEQLNSRLSRERAGELGEYVRVHPVASGTAADIEADRPSQALTELCRNLAWAATIVAGTARGQTVGGWTQADVTAAMASAEKGLTERRERGDLESPAMTTRESRERTIS